MPGATGRVLHVHISGPLMRVDVDLCGQTIEVLIPPEMEIPAQGEACVLQLIDARFYPKNGAPSAKPLHANRELLPAR
jgi:hypothetical protein